MLTSLMMSLTDEQTNWFVGQDSMVLLTQVRPYRASKVTDCFHKKIIF